MIALHNIAKSYPLPRGRRFTGAIGSPEGGGARQEGTGSYA